VSLGPETLGRETSALRVESGRGREEAQRPAPRTQQLLLSEAERNFLRDYWQLKSGRTPEKKRTEPHQGYAIQAPRYPVD
jgi:hypothetical protein